MTNDIEYLLCLFTICIFSLMKYLFNQVFCSFVNWVLMEVLYIIWTLVFFQMYNLLWVCGFSFSYCLPKSRISLLKKVYLTFGFLSKKFLPNLRSQKYCPIFSSRNYIAVRFTFRIMLSFEIVFIYGEIYGLKFIFLHIVSNYFSIYVEKILIPLHLFWKSNFHIFVGLLLDCLFCSINVCVYLYANTHHFDYCNYTKS